MGVSLRTTEQIRKEQGQVTRDGHYTLRGGRFRIRAGDVLPEGAVFDPLPGERQGAPAEPEQATATVVVSMTDTDAYKALVAERDALQAKVDAQPGEATVDAIDGDPTLKALLSDLGLVAEDEAGELIVNTEGVEHAARDIDVLTGAVEQLVSYLAGADVAVETETEESVDESAHDQQPPKDPADKPKQDPESGQRMQPAAPENRALQGAPQNRRKAKKGDD